MKKLLFLILCLSVLCFSTGCAAPESEESAPTAQEEILPEVEVLPEGAPDVPEIEEFSPILVEETVLEGYFDEVCTYELSLPSVSCPDAEVSAKINDFYLRLGQSLEDYAGGTVYDAAQARNCVAHVRGEFSYAQDGDVLSVDYTVYISYSDADEDALRERTDSFDLGSGELIES